MVEKSPANTLRVGYLEELHPGPRYVHLVRDGAQVAASIGRIAGRNRWLALGGRQDDWWGVRHAKWKLLAAERARLPQGHDEVPLLRDDRARGAYEWMLGMLEVDRHRDVVGPRLLDVDYLALTCDPRALLPAIAAHSGLDPAPDWLAGGAERVRAGRDAAEELALPPALCEVFNDLQARFGFRSRATPARASGAER
jgi:Sulfotransferase family